MTKSQGFAPIGETAGTVTVQSQKRDGFNAGKDTAVATAPDSSAIAAYLAKNKPTDMDKAAVSRALSHGVELQVKYDLRFPSGPNGEHLPSYTVAGGCAIQGKAEDVERALTDLRNFMTPADKRDIEAWIAELSVVSAKRKEDDFTEELRIEVYASRLSRYPADVVRHVLLNESYKFFPSWDELQKRCDAMTSPRRAMIAALEKGPPEPERERVPPTDEEKARMAAHIAALFPDAPKQWVDRAMDEVTPDAPKG